MSDPFNYIEFLLFLRMSPCHEFGAQVESIRNSMENDPNLCSAGFLLRLLLLLLIPRTEQELTCGQLVEAAGHGRSRRLVGHNLDGRFAKSSDIMMIYFSYFFIILMSSIYRSI